MSAITVPCLQVSRLTGSTTGATPPKRARLAWPRPITTMGRTPASPCAGGASPPSEWRLTRALALALGRFVVNNSMSMTPRCFFGQGLQSTDGSAEVGQQREVGGATG